MDGGSPFALIQARDDNFYGATNYDGFYRYGTLFSEVTPNGGIYHAARLRLRLNGSDGTQPTGVTQAIDGNFYGITEGGGTDYAGTVFRLVDSATVYRLFDGAVNSLLDGCGCEPTLSSRHWISDMRASVEVRRSAN